MKRVPKIFLIFLGREQVLMLKISKQLEGSTRGLLCFVTESCRSITLKVSMKRWLLRLNHRLDKNAIASFYACDRKSSPIAHCT
jgi:hypothetical protein